MFPHSQYIFYCLCGKHCCPHFSEKCVSELILPLWGGVRSRKKALLLSWFATIVNMSSTKCKDTLCFVFAESLVCQKEVYT